jgi:hypothetical protein
MTTLLLLCLALLDCVVPSGPGMSCSPQADLPTLAGFIKGRLLLCCVRKGMTPEQVERILGRPGSSFLVGGPMGFTYLDHGVSVYFEDGKVTHYRAMSLVKEEVLLGKKGKPPSPAGTPPDPAARDSQRARP